MTRTAARRPKPAHRPAPAPRPATEAELGAQQRFGSQDRAQQFYDEQMLDVLTPRMQEFVGQQAEFVVASADRHGHPEASVRFGEPGFAAVLDERTLCWPELRGNGVMTTLGNIADNPRVHLMFLDHGERIGLHLRGAARIVEPDEMGRLQPQVVAEPRAGRAPDRWVIMQIDTAYIHCRKHFPREDAPVEWGTDNVRAKGGDYFGAKATPSPWSPGE